MGGLDTPSTLRRLMGAVLLGGPLLTLLLVSLRPAGADTLLATGDELPGLGRVQQIIPQVCVSSDGGILTTVRGEDGRSAFVCSDGSGSRVVLRSGDPEPTGRVFDDLQYGGSCSFTRDGHVIFSATTLRPVVGSDGQVQQWVEAAIYRIGASGITRMLGTGDQTSEGTVEILSSVQYSASSAGTVLAYSVFVGGLDLRSGRDLWGRDQWFLVSDAGIAPAFPYDSLPSWEDQSGQGVYPAIPALTGQGEFLALGKMGDRDQETGLNALLEWTTAPGRVVATNSDLASDGFLYGKIRNGREHSWGLSRMAEPPSIRNDTIVFAARVALAGRQHQTRFFRYTPGDVAPQLVFAPAAPGEPSVFDPWIIDSNANGDILLFDSTTSYVARSGQALESIHRDLGPCSANGCPGVGPVGLSNGGVVFSVIYPVYTPSDWHVTLETDLGTAAGTSCSLLPTVPPDASPTPTASPVPATPTPRETATPDDAVPANPVCVGDCNADGIVTVGELTTGVNILLGNMPMSMCPACQPASGEPMTVDVIIRAVSAALGGCP